MGGKNVPRSSSRLPAAPMTRSDYGFTLTYTVPQKEDTPVGLPRVGPARIMRKHVNELHVNAKNF